MPVYSKRTLRQLLGTRYLHDMPTAPAQVAALSATIGLSPVSVLNNYFADTGNSGQNLYQGAWLYVEGSTAIGVANAQVYQYLVATFNAGSGAFVSTGVARDYHSAFSRWELHTRISPEDKNNALDDTIKRIRLHQEVAIPTIDGALAYALDSAGSPFVVDRVLNVYVFANPSGTADRDLRYLDDFQVVTTATGNELRLLYGLQGSQQLVLDAILIPSLGSELATLNIPDERWILAGAAARCYDYLIQDAPAQQVAGLEKRRQEAALEFSRLTTRFAPAITKPIRMNDLMKRSSQSSASDGWW